VPEYPQPLEAPGSFEYPQPFEVPVSAGIPAANQGSSIFFLTSGFLIFFCLKYKVLVRIWFEMGLYGSFEADIQDFIREIDFRQDLMGLDANSLDFLRFRVSHEPLPRTGYPPTL